MASAINRSFGLDYEAWTAVAECVFVDNCYRKRLEGRFLCSRCHEDRDIEPARKHQDSIANDRPVYDFMYLALAQRLSTRLVTAGQCFVNALAMTEHSGLVMALNNAMG